MFLCYFGFLILLLIPLGAKKKALEFFSELFLIFYLDFIKELNVIFYTVFFKILLSDYVTSLIAFGLIILFEFKNNRYRIEISYN